MCETVEDVRAEFIEKVGLMAQADGLPRAAGRLLGLLIFDGQATSFASLAEQLQISRGSISSATRVLEDRALIKRVTKPGERQDYFQLSDAPYTSMLGAVKAGIQRSCREIDATLARLPPDQAGPRARIEEYADLYKALGNALDAALEAVNTRRAQ